MREVSHLSHEAMSEDLSSRAPPPEIVRALRRITRTKYAPVPPLPLN
jgi:hypothetical protein